MPVLYMRGARVPPISTTAYFAPGRKDNASIEAWPQGFRMIADLKNATEANTGYPHAGWLCGSGLVNNGFAASLTDIKYHCPSGLQARVIFPDCWDGVNLDTVQPDGTAGDQSRHGSALSERPPFARRVRAGLRQLPEGPSGRHAARRLQDPL